MSDKLIPIRRLYADPPDADGPEPEELGPDEAAELAALRPLRDALDALPRLRPDPGVVDEVVAAATFQAIRSLYAEGAAADVTPSAAEEATLLAPVKAALDALPRERPAPEVVDEVVAAATAKSILTLYGVRVDADLTPGAATELALLAPVKAGLDALPPQRPDAARIDAIMAAARGGLPVERRRQDRGPERGRTRRRIVQGASTLAAIALVAVATLWVTREQAPGQFAVAQEQIAQSDVVPEPEAVPDARSEPEASGSPVTTPQSAPPPPPQVVAEAAPPPSAAPSRAAARLAQPLALEYDAEPVFAAAGEIEASEEALRLLYLRLEALQEENQLWDEPPTVLGAQPPTRPAASHGWMQVRVNR